MPGRLSSFAGTGVSRRGGGAHLSEQSSEESATNWKMEFIVLDCLRPPCGREEFEPLSGTALPALGFEAQVNSGGEVGLFVKARAPAGGGSGASGASGARGASGGGAAATSVRVEAAGDTVRVSGLADTVVHQIRVRLVNADGVPGVASDSVAVVPLRAQAGDGQVTLSWDSPGHDRLEEWQYRQQRGLGSWGEWQDVPGSTGSTTSHTVTGLANGETYGFQVRGVYELAAGSYRAGAVSFSRRAMPVGKPDAPGNLEADPGDAQVVLTWQTPFNNGSSLTGYEYRQGAYQLSGGERTWSERGGFRGLVKGSGDAGPGAAPVRNPEASGANGQVELSWDAPLSGRRCRPRRRRFRRA